MLDKVLASVQIGAATVDTRLADDHIRPGGTIVGEVVVEGGEADQRIEGLEHRLTAAQPEAEDEIVLDSWQVTREFVIEEGEQQIIPFEARVHPETPVTETDASNQQTEVWIDTGLAIDKAIDSSDTDHLRVEPTDEMVQVIDAMRSLGFELHTIEEDHQLVTIDDREARTWMDQEFKFRPTDRTDPRFGEYEVSFVPRPMESYTQFLFELEGNGRDETFAGMAIEHVYDMETETLADNIDSVLRRA